jgi:carbon storage regulator CsrA
MAAAMWPWRTRRLPTTNAKEYAVLVLTRKALQQIQIGDKITITILRVKGNAVRVGIDAPRDERIIRSELNEKPAAQQGNSIAAAARRGVESVTARDIKDGPAQQLPIADETECVDREAAAAEMVRPLANRVRMLTSQPIRYPERLSAASLR